MTSHIKAVFFDLDGTLRIPTPGPTAAFIHFARSLDVDIPPIVEKRVKIWAHQYWGQDDLVKEDMERFDTDGFWINYSKLLLETVDVSQDVLRRAKLVREWFDTGYQPDVQLVAGCHEVLSELKESGLVLGVISNRPNPLDQELQRLGLDDYFEVTLAAGEIGCWKPNPQIFNHVLQRFPDLKAEACVYVGDNYYADGRGAEAAGLLPVLYDPENLYEKSTYWRIKHMRELRALLLNSNGRIKIDGRQNRANTLFGRI